MNIKVIDEDDDEDDFGFVRHVINSSVCFLQIVSSASTDLQDYTYYFVPAPWLSCKLLRLLQCYPPPEDGAVKGRLVECLETILNKAQEPPKSKKVQHSNAKNAILFEAISLIIHYDRCVSSSSSRGRSESRKYNKILKARIIKAGSSVHRTSPCS